MKAPTESANAIPQLGDTVHVDWPSSRSTFAYKARECCSPSDHPTVAPSEYCSDSRPMSLAAVGTDKTPRSAMSKISSPDVSPTFTAKLRSPAPAAVKAWPEPSVSICSCKGAASCSSHLLETP
jgi:hypothetical protein